MNGFPSKILENALSQTRLGILTNYSITSTFCTKNNNKSMGEKIGYVQEF